jgi:hypothetical protein
MLVESRVGGRFAKGIVPLIKLKKTSIISSQQREDRYRASPNGCKSQRFGRQLLRDIAFPPSPLIQ